MEKIDKFIYINLAHRTDRREHVLNELRKVCIDDSKIIRFDAVYNKERGALGCTQSHIGIQKMVMEHPEWKIVCVLEDDCTFYDPMIPMFNESFKKITETMEWDIVLLAYANIVPDHYKYEQVDNSIVRMIKAQTTTGYIINTQYATKLYNNFTTSYNMLLNGYNNPVNCRTIEHCYAIDQYWQTLMKTDRWFSTVPMVAYQFASYSDIERQHCDYFKNSFKNI